MPKFRYVGTSDSFEINGKTLVRGGEAVDLTDAEAAYIRAYPFGLNKLVAEDTPLGGGFLDRPGEVFVEAADQDLTPSAGGHGNVLEAQKILLDMQKEGDGTAHRRASRRSNDSADGEA